jgi:transcriptional regulator with XRE-family HTH domain
MTEIGDGKTTFSSRLKEKRIEKGWSQHYLAARAGCTNSNISYLEKHPTQQPKIETVEGLASALDWPINEARRLAGYPESDDNLSPLEVEDDFRLALHGYKELSEHGREMVKKQIAWIIEFVSECERRASGISFEDQASGNPGSSEVPALKLDKLDRQTEKKKVKKKK